jgi:ATP-dependent DNA ligase
MMAVLFRKREKGRDLFDVSFLMGLTKPDFDYVQKALGVFSEEFLHRFTKRLDELDLNYLARDVEPFLFDSAQKDIVLYFKDMWNDGQ